MAQAKPSFLHKVFYILAILIGADLGWRIGINLDSTLLSIIFAIIGAVVISSLVGFIAMKIFNYKP